MGSICNTIPAIAEQRVYEREADVNHRRTFTSKRLHNFPESHKGETQFREGALTSSGEELKPEGRRAEGEGA